MFFDGDHCGYFSIGIAVDDSIVTNSESAASFPELIAELCKATFYSPHRKASGVCALKDFFGVAAELYLNGSIRGLKAEDGGHGPARLETTTPLVIVSTSIDFRHVIKQWKR